LAESIDRPIEFSAFAASRPRGLPKFAGAYIFGSKTSPNFSRFDKRRENHGFTKKPRRLVAAAKS
jgi:hypothetical protein